MTSPIMEATGITKQFGTQKILNGIDLTIEENSFTAILGPSGSGKSTLMNILAGLTRPSTGNVLFQGNDITRFTEKQTAHWKREHIGNVFQNYLLLNNLTAEENIKISITKEKPALSFSRLVNMLEIESVLKKLPSQMSGGQQQRVAIARAVIKCPDIVFCDEATGALDEANSKKVVKLLHMIKSTFGIAIVFVTHNTQIAETANRVLTIKDGILAGDKTNNQPLAADEMVWG